MGTFYVPQARKSVRLALYRLGSDCTLHVPLALGLAKVRFRVYLNLIGFLKHLQAINQSDTDPVWKVGALVMVLLNSIGLPKYIVSPVH